MDPRRVIIASMIGLILIGSSAKADPTTTLQRHVPPAVHQSSPGTSTPSSTSTQITHSQGQLSSVSPATAASASPHLPPVQIPSTDTPELGIVAVPDGLHPSSVATPQTGQQSTGLTSSSPVSPQTAGSTLGQDPGTALPMPGTPTGADGSGPSSGIAVAPVPGEAQQCVTPWGSCQMAVHEAPIGVNCWCPGEGGLRIAGSTR